MRIEARIAGLRQWIGLLAGRAGAAQKDAEERITATLEEARQQRTTAVDDAESDFQAATDSATASHENAVRRLLQQLRDADEHSRLNSAAGNQAVRAPNPLTRVGNIRGTEGDEAPLNIALIDSSGVVISSTEKTRRLALELMRSILADIVDQVPVQHLRLSIFDPNVTSALADFGHLAQARPESVPPPITEAFELRQRLSEIFAHVHTTASVLKRADARSLSEYWRTLDTPEGEYHVLVLLDFPHGLDRETANQLAKFSHVATKGALLIALRPLDIELDEDIAAADAQILTGCEHLIVHSNSLELSSHPASHRFQTYISYDSDDVRATVDRAVAAANDSRGPTVELKSVLETSGAQFWQSSAAEGLETAIGRAQNDLLSVRFRSASPAMTNMLVGGAVGQGKSNLLLDIIYGLTYSYPPEELELYLLDFKEGLEFKRFGPDAEGNNWLPHASLIALDTNQAYGLMVLHHIEQQLAERNRLFKDAGAHSYDEYRRLGHSLPRLLIIVDEFQMMFTGDDDIAEQAADLLANLARLGRAAGIHLILASQTLSGIRAIASREQSIFGQFAARLSLKNKASESETILSTGNKAAAELTYRGEVVLNENYGEDTAHNRRGISAYADPDFVAPLQKRQWQAAEGRLRRRPFVFNPHAYASFDRHGTLALASDDPDDIVLDLGRQLSVEERSASFTMRDDENQALAIIGNAGGETAGVFAAAVRSLYLARPQDRIIVVNADSAARPAWLDGLEDYEPALAAKVEYIDRQQAEEFVAESLPTLDNATVVILGLQKLRKLNDRLNSDPTSFDRVEASEFLAQHIGTGADNSIRFVLGFGSTDAIKSVFGYRGDVIGCYALVNQDKRVLVDVTQMYDIKKPSESPRFVLHSRGTGGRTLTAVPFDAPVRKESAE